jgi:hypothetical protein
MRVIYKCEFFKLFNFFQCQQQIISFTHPQSPSSPIKFKNLLNSQNDNNNNKIPPPPPPPKRAEGTRLQSIQTQIIDSMPSLKMDMLAELTLATNKQKMRLENELSNNYYNEGKHILKS